MSQASYNFLGQVVKLILQLVLAYAVIVLAGGFVTLLWVNLQGNAGIYHLQYLMQQDIYYLSQQVSLSNWTIDTSQINTQANTWLQHQSLFLHAAKLKTKLLAEQQLCIVIMQWLLLRTAYFLYLLKFLGLLSLVGLVDGLSQRTIRRCNGQRESATIYHQAKTCCLFFTILLMLMIVFIPIPLQKLSAGLSITCLLIALLTQITAKQFKKYI